MTETTEKRVFWQKILGAVGAEYKDQKSIIGVSGISHSVVAIGKDEAGKRLVIVSGEYDAKAAALSQVDIQLTMPDIRVCLIRPVLISLPQLASSLMDALGSSRIYTSRLKLLQKPYFKKRFELKSKEFLDNNIGTITKKFESIPLSVVGQMQYIMQQIISEEMGLALKGALDDTEDPNKKGYFNLSAFESVDILKHDRALGICGLPLFEFAESDIEFVLSGNLDDIKQMLVDRDIYQFFFPSADTTILGLIERGLSNKELSEQVSLLPQIGHPFGDAEIVKASSPIPDMVKELQSMNLIVEGEMSLSLSEKGESIRGKIKFKPREGVLSKLVNRLRLNVGVHFSGHN